MAGQIFDYYFVRKTRLHVPMLYQNEGIYRYKGGFNWRALLTLLIVIPINLPGLINAINKKVKIGNYMYFCKSHFAFLSALPLTSHVEPNWTPAERLH